MTVRPITEMEYSKIVEWNIGKDKDYLMQWAGDREYRYPITEEQIQRREKEKNSRIYIIDQDGDAIGTIGLNRIDEVNSSANVCRFLLSDEAKGKGYGRQALGKLAELAFGEMKLKRLTLGVYAFNVGAIRCYETCGFRVKEYYQNENPRWNGYIMEKSAI